jgi:hypothetical protein
MHAVVLTGDGGDSGAMAFHEADGGGDGGISNSGRLRRKRGRGKEGGSGSGGTTRRCSAVGPGPDTQAAS